MELGPLEIVFCWQSVALSILVYATTRSIKSAMIMIAGESKVKQAWVKYVLLPILPLGIGCIFGICIPVRPEMIELYASSKNPYLVYACWGAMVGQFADYIHQRISSVTKLKEAK